jgi:uncharacterized protein (DUF4415 family)
MNVVAKPPADYDENPEWLEEDFALAKPIDDVFPADVVSALVRNRGGRPVGSNKEQISLRLDKDLLEHWRSAGPGWQSRINQVLRQASMPDHSLVAASLAQGNGARLNMLAAR